jgi:hypothetical protein
MKLASSVTEDAQKILRKYQSNPDINAASEIIGYVQEILQYHQNSIPDSVPGFLSLVLNLKPEIARALHVIAREFHPRKKNDKEYAFTIADIAIKFALSDPDKFSDWIENQLKYSEDEGLELYHHINQLVAGHKKYRRKPLPQQWR